MTAQLNNLNYLNTMMQKRDINHPAMETFVYYQNYVFNLFLQGCDTIICWNAASRSDTKPVRWRLSCSV